jgi:hypothetical protein
MLVTFDNKTKTEQLNALQEAGAYIAIQLKLILHFNYFSSPITVARTV